METGGPYVRSNESFMAHAPQEVKDCGPRRTHTAAWTDPRQHSCHSRRVGRRNVRGPGDM